MFVRQLTYLVALSQHRHFAQAAESCNVSQPALSAGLRQLEKELGITIIRRDRRFNGFTPEGERVLLWARQMLASLDSLRQEAELSKTLSGGHLELGVVPSSLQASMLLTIAYRRAVPELRLGLHSLSTRAILQRVKRHEAHLGITYLDQIPQQAFEVQPLYTERYILVASANAGQTLPPALDWKDAAQLPLCLFGREMHNREIIDMAFRQAGVTPRVMVETNTISMLYAMVRNGEMYSVMPLSALPGFFIGRDITLHRLEPAHGALVAMLRLRQSMMPPLIEEAWRVTAEQDLQGTLDRVLEDEIHAVHRAS
ncbi:LysR family transcriptional regulator [Solilutibacter silvestris]|uniref:Transcriptional regulator n=1 Tax=Solilutibacter silvestris TaxID=1645665 RepID=A0A2K1Q358_9GAMM|nr:LysR family transcriptional regulator [Lysobacter silvestris]PNS09474.1 Transcriptional regulator [Lysobacter silvestris]